jgi:hypothetical protein
MSAPATSPEMEFVSAPAPAPIKSSVLPQPRHLEITSCANEISKLNTALEKLAQQVSPSCNSLLMAPRDVTCLTTIDKCNIHKMSLVNADSGARLVENFTIAMSFCSTLRARVYDTLLQSYKVVVVVVVVIHRFLTTSNDDGSGRVRQVRLRRRRSST